jgi:hypothetical protein
MVAPARLARVAKLERTGGAMRPHAIGLRVIVHPGEDQEAAISAAIEAKERELGHAIDRQDVLVIVRTIVSPGQVAA